MECLVPKDWWNTKALYVPESWEMSFSSTFVTIHLITLTASYLSHRRWIFYTYPVGKAAAQNLKGNEFFVCMGIFFRKGIEVVDSK